VRMNLLAPGIVGLVLFLSSGAAFPGDAAGRQGPDAFPGLLRVPDAFQKQYEKMDLWLSRRLAEWRPATYRSVRFGAYHVTASEQLFRRTDRELDGLLLDVFEEAGVELVSAYLWPGNYEKQKERYHRLFRRIRKAGMALLIGLRFEGVPMTWAQYRSATMDFTRRIVGTVKPEYYAIVIEPTSHGEQKHGFKASVAEWIQLVSEASSLSKRVSPRTKTLVGGHRLELDFLRTAADLRHLDAVGFNVYGRKGLRAIVKTIEHVENLGKETWILETWLTLRKHPTFNAPWRQPLDAKWIRFIAYLAQRYSVEGIIPFFTVRFVGYFPRNTDLAAVKQAFRAGRRTMVFRTYQDVVAEVRKHTDTKGGKK